MAHPQAACRDCQFGTPNPQEPACQDVVPCVPVYRAGPVHWLRRACSQSDCYTPCAVGSAIGGRPVASLCTDTMAAPPGPAFTAWRKTHTPVNSLTQGSQKSVHKSKSGKVGSKGPPNTAQVDQKGPRHGTLMGVVRCNRGAAARAAAAAACCRACRRIASMGDSCCRWKAFSQCTHAWSL
jgi:hypothetical protein